MHYLSQNTEGEFKQCRTCGEWKPKTLDFFHHRKESRDGLKSSCKACQNENAKRYRIENPEKIKAIAKSSRQKHIEKRKNKIKEWNKKNIEWRKKWELENKNKRKKYVYNYRKNLSPEKKQELVEKNKIRSQEWRKKNPDYQKEYLKKYAIKNKERLSVIARNYKARKKKADGKHTKEDVAQIIKNQKGLCFWCNQKLDKIHMDHYIPLKKGGSNNAQNLVASCPKCNQSKGAKMPWDFTKAKAQELFPHLKITHATADACLIAEYGRRLQ
jgi:hypothetical protein